MSLPGSFEPPLPAPSRLPPLMPDTSRVTDRQLSPTPSTSPSFADTSTDTTYPAPRDAREEALGAKLEGKIKKKFSELDIRGAIGDLDIRKGGKRTGIEDFYIQLEEPHRIFWCPGEIVKGIMPVFLEANGPGQVNLILDRPVKTQYIILRLVGLVSVSMLREKVEHAIFEEELVLWGTKIYGTAYDRTHSRDDASEYESPKKPKDEWEVGLMEEGEHPFGFEFELPAKSMPSSIDV